MQTAVTHLVEHRSKSEWPDSEHKLSLDGWRKPPSLGCLAHWLFFGFPSLHKVGGEMQQENSEEWTPCTRVARVEKLQVSNEELR